MPHTFDLVITGRTKQVLLEDPRTPSGFRVVKDTSPMRVSYISSRHSTDARELRWLEKVANDNPQAQVTLPDGRQMSLAQWLQNPSPEAPPAPPLPVDGPPSPAELKAESDAAATTQTQSASPDATPASAQIVA